MTLHQLRHDALLYRDDAELVGAVSAFVRGGLDAGEQTVAVLPPAGAAGVRDVLGPDARHVTFVDPEAWYLRPGATLAAFRASVDELPPSGRIRAVGEIPLGRGAWPDTRWLRFEAVLNAAFAAVPAWVLCPYDVRRHSPEVVDDVRRTHPHVWHDGRRTESGAFAEPALVLDRHAVEHPRPDGDPTLRLTIGDDLRRVRDHLRALAPVTGFDDDRTDEVVLAVSEVVANAARHTGATPATVLAWAATGRLVCEVHDTGPGLAATYAGYLPPAAGAHGGMGLWIARRLADTLTVIRETGTTVVRLTFGS